MLPRSTISPTVVPSAGTSVMLSSVVMTLTGSAVSIDTPCRAMRRARLWVGRLDQEVCGSHTV